MDNTISHNQPLPLTGNRSSETIETSTTVSQTKAEGIAEDIKDEAINNETSAEASESQQELDIESVVTDINEYTQNLQRSLKFSVSEETGRTIIQVYNTETNELIRQIPHEELATISEALQQGIREGILFKQHV